PVKVLLLTAFNARMHMTILLIRRVHPSRGGVRGRGGTDFEMPPGLADAAHRPDHAGDSGRIDRSWAETGRPAYRRGVRLLALLGKAPGKRASQTGRSADVATKNRSTLPERTRSLSGSLVWGREAVRRLLHTISASP